MDDMSHIESDITPPLDKKIQIWRYIDLPKFVSMLDKRALHFSNIQDVDDPYEGILPKADLEKIKQEIQEGMKKKKTFN